MPKYEDSYINNKFDLYSLDISLSKPIHLCAFEFLKENKGTIIVSNKLKSLANIQEEGVNIYLEKANMISNQKLNKNLSLESNYKYTIAFDNIVVQAMVPFEEDKYLAVASVDALKKYLPADINLDVNKDLMGVAFDAFVVNRGNKNGHIIGTDVALSMVENFINKPFNIEHNRKVVVGVCTGYGFSEFGTSKPINYEDIKNTNEPFNVVLSGYVWKIVNPEFAEELLESSDPSSKKYLSVSASWELGFNEFNIAKGNKNLSEAEIIDNEEELQKLKSSLRVFGGSGADEDGNSLFLNLKGTVLPLGIGFTNTPAAEVKGVTVSNKNINLQSNASSYEIKENVEGCSGFAVFEDGEIEECFDSKDKAEAYIQKEQEETETNTNDEEIDSSEIKMNKKSVLEVNKNVKKIMKIENLDDINDDSLKSIEASAVRDFIKDRISQLSKEWETKISEKEAEATQANSRVSELENELALVKEQSSKIQSELDSIVEKIKAEEIEANFQKRMSLLDEEFNLSDADREIVAEDLRTISDEEQFNKWYNKFSTLASGKKKAALEVVNESPKQEEAKACNSCVAQSGEKTVEEIVLNAEHKEEVLPNASNSQEVSLFEKINAAFNKSSIKIK
jgi:hypothetical protein